MPGPKARGAVFIEKRTRGDGTVAHRLKWGDPNIRDDKGRMIPQSLTFDDSSQARIFASLLEAANGELADAAAIGAAIKAKVPTVAAMIEQHIKLLTGVESRTRADYRKMAALHINPHIGALPADTISRERLKEWVNDVYETGPRHLGAALRDFRTDRTGMTRAEVAAKLERPVSWVADYEKGDVRLTAAQFRTVCGALDVPVRDRDQLARLGKPMSAKTLKNIHSLLSHAFTTANLERQLRPDNPAKGIPLPTYHRPENVYLTPLEFSVLLSKFSHAAWKHPVQFTASTGVRWGELVALTVGDLHLNNAIPYVSVNKAVKRGEDGRGSYTGAPKSLMSRRLVSLPATLVTMLRELTAGRPREALLFTGPEGGPLHYSNFRTRVWLPAVAAAYAERNADGFLVGLGERIPYKRVRIHDLRHSHASWMIMKRVDMFAVKSRLGHESITTTYNTYGHLDPRQLQQGAEAMEEILSEVMPPSPELDPFDPVMPDTVGADVIDWSAAVARITARTGGERVELDPAVIADMARSEELAAQIAVLRGEKSEVDGRLRAALGTLGEVVDLAAARRTRTTETTDMTIETDAISAAELDAEETG